MRKLLVILLILSIAFACQEQGKWSPLANQILEGNASFTNIEGTSSIRGISISADHAIWLSGNNATYSISSDSGESWKTGKIGLDSTIDYRDIEAFDLNTAVAISAGFPLLIYRTENRGESWNLVHSDSTDGVFYNSMAFKDDLGIAVGDPIDNVFQVLITKDSGKSWELLNKQVLPQPLEMEAGFAASGTSVYFSGDKAYAGFGGEQARILCVDFSTDTITAKMISTDFIAGNPSLGIYSIDFTANGIGCITGGNWEKPDIADKNLAYSFDSGFSWKLSDYLPNGYRSCVQFFKGTNETVLTGRGGVDVVNFKTGKVQLSKLPGFYTVRLAKNNEFAVFAGSDGRVAIVNKIK